MSEEDTVALKSWDLDTEELLSGGGVPHTDIVDRASSEKLRVTIWEHDVIDSLIMASVSQFWVDRVGVAPVDGGLVGLIVIVIVVLMEDAAT